MSDNFTNTNGDTNGSFALFSFYGIFNTEFVYFWGSGFRNMATTSYKANVNLINLVA